MRGIKAATNIFGVQAVLAGRDGSRGGREQATSAAGVQRGVCVCVFFISATMPGIL